MTDLRLVSFSGNTKVSSEKETVTRSENFPNIFLRFVLTDFFQKLKSVSCKKKEYIYTE